MAKKTVNALETDAAALESHIEFMERRFDRLKSLYESFFMGVEKQPPSVARREMNRLILATQQININKAALRFRFQTLNQRWVTYIAYWNRTMREMESGTYRRDVAKARRLMEKNGIEMTEEQAIAMGIPAGRAKAFVQQQNRRLKPAATQIPAAPASPGPNTTPGRAEPAKAIPGVTESELQDFYRQYCQARARLGDDRQSHSLDDIRTKLGPQIAKVLHESGSRRASLEVVVDGGRVRVRARARLDTK